jgi:hypothetical protein
MTSEITSLRVNAVDRELIYRAKRAALDRRVSFKQFLIEALNQYIQQTEEPKPRRNRREG